MEATSPSTFTASLACGRQPTSGIICMQETWSCSHAAVSTHLKSVLTVKLEGVLYSCNAAIVYDLARLGDAFRDLEQAVCGRDKLEVTCDGTTGKRQAKGASEQSGWSLHSHPSNPPHVMVEKPAKKAKERKKENVEPRTSCSSLLSTVIMSAVTSLGGLKPTSSAKRSRSFHQSAPPRHSPAKTNYNVIFSYDYAGSDGSRMPI